MSSCDKSQRNARNLGLKGMCFPIFPRLPLSALLRLLVALLWSLSIVRNRLPYSTLAFLSLRVRLYRLVDFTAPRWAPCKKRKLACCLNSRNRYNSSQFLGSGILAYNQPKSNSKTCRTSTYKISHMIYIYHSIKGITKWSRSKCQSNDSDNP